MIFKITLSQKSNTFKKRNPFTHDVDFSSYNGHINRQTDRQTHRKKFSNGYLQIPSNSGFFALGRKMTVQTLLQDIGIDSVQQLQDSPLQNLSRILGDDPAKRMKDLSFGRDFNAVKMSGRVQTIGVEDRFKMLTSEEECMVKMEWLVDKLVALVTEDGRTPTTLRSKLHMT